MTTTGGFTVPRMFAADQGAILAAVVTPDSYFLLQSSGEIRAYDGAGTSRLQSPEAGPSRAVFGNSISKCGCVTCGHRNGFMSTARAEMILANDGNDLWCLNQWGVILRVQAQKPK